MAERYCHFNGEIIPVERARIDIADPAFLHGASTFTTMLAHNGKVFRLDRHLSRLLATASHFELRTDAAAEGLAAGVRALLEANALDEARMRITLTPGPIGADKPTTLITADALPNYPRWWYDKGVTVLVSPYKQSDADPTAGYKTGCYLPRLLARGQAAAKGAEEALWFTQNNHLAEACFCNVFLVLDGKVHTPSLEMSVLPGISREAVLELCEQLGIEADHKLPLTVRHMLGAQEIFLTSSTMGIRPVVRVERHAVGEEKPGPVTRKLMDAYRQLLETECPPRTGKGTQS